MTIEEWISRFDNEEADHLTQEEQLELKHFLIELNGYWMVLEAKKKRRADDGDE